MTFRIKIIKPGKMGFPYDTAGTIVEGEWHELRRAYLLTQPARMARSSITDLWVREGYAELVKEPEEADSLSWPIYPYGAPGPVIHPTEDLAHGA